MKDKDEQAGEGVHSSRSSRVPTTAVSVPTGDEYTTLLSPGCVHQLRGRPNPIV